LTYLEYFEELINTGNYAGKYDIINAKIKFNCNIIIYRNNKYNHNNNKYKFDFETIINKYKEDINPFIPMILIGWVNNNLYVLLFPKNYEEENIGNNYNNLEISNKKDNLNKDLMKILIQNNKKSLVKKENKELQKYSNNDINFKDILSNYVKNDKSKYPILKEYKYGETKLEDIYNFLLVSKMLKIQTIEKYGHNIY